MKKLILLLSLVILFLTGCGKEFEVGETIVLQDLLFASESQEEFHEMIEKMETDESDKFVNGEDGLIVFEEEEIRIVEITDDELVLIEVLDGVEEGEFLWTDFEELRYATGSEE